MPDDAGLVERSVDPPLEPLEPADYRGRPILARRRLKRELADARARLGWTQEYATRQLAPWSRNKLVNIETGKFKQPDPSLVDRMAAAYGPESGLDADRIDNLKKLVLEVRAGASAWWQDWADIFTDDFVGLEAEALVIRAYEPSNVPGLCQTGVYMSETMSAYPFTDPAERQRRVMARMLRQQLLDRNDPPPPQIHLLIEEAALTRRFGTVNEHIAQLRLLAELASRDNITLQVLPRFAPLHAGTNGGKFTWLEFIRPEPAVVYLENEISAQIIDDPAALTQFSGIWDLITQVAPPPETTIDQLRQLEEEIAGLHA